MKFLKSPGIWIFIIQVLLVSYIFRDVLFHPGTSFTSSRYDGIRTLFVIQTYVEQEGPNAWNKYQYMNYPYGEHTVFAGGTPLFSVIIKFLYDSHIISSQWVIPVYFMMVLSSIPITAFFLYLLVGCLLKDKWIAFILGLTLPWINYQFNRLFVGHFDLAMTCFLLINIYTLVMVARKWSEWKSNWYYWFGHFLMLILLAYIHLYLAAIIALFTSLFCILFGWLYRNESISLKSNLISSLAGGFVSGIAFVTILLLFAFTDPNASERKAIPEGYNWSEWNAQFSSMFTPSHGEKIKFPLLSNAPIKYENDTYLSSFVLYGFLLLLFTFLFGKRFGITFRMNSLSPISFEGKTILTIFLSSLIMLFISFGEEFYLLSGEYQLKNYLNLFILIKKAYPQIQQFRVLARFNFYFFWAANLLVAYLLIKNYKEYTWGRVLIGVLLLLSLIDLRDRLKFSKANITKDDVFHSRGNVIPTIDYNDYQAILPIPYYIAGNEDYNITIDPEDDWNTFTYYLSYHSKLPLIASKMPRTSLVQARSQISLFTDNPDKGLLSKLIKVNKPILVVYNSSLPRIPIGQDRPLAQSINENFGKFLEREAGRLKKIATYNNLDYYSWNPGL